MTEEKKELIKAQEKKHESNSIILKVMQFQRYAEFIDEPEDESEIKELLADIANHAEWIIEYIKRLEINSAELKEKAKKFSEGATTQANKAKRYKDYLKQALRSSGFEQLPAGDLMLKLVKSVTYKPKTAPTEDDFLAMTDFVDTKFEWKRDPEVSDFIDDQEKVNRVFSWKEAMIKAEIKAQKKTLDKKKSTDEEKAEAQERLDELMKFMEEEDSYKLNVGVRKIEK